MISFSYSKPPSILFLIFVLTTPPTPNAGTILQTRNAKLGAQSFNTFAVRLAILTAPLPSLCGLLYKSNPNKCNGVLTTCTAAGAKNCAALILLKLLSMPSLIGNLGATTGGRLKLAKIVNMSRAANRAYVAFGTGPAAPALATPKSRVN